MSKNGSVVTGYKYYFDIQMALGRGPIDALLSIYAGDLEAWNSEQTTTGNFPINKPELFGGDKAEGGIDGTARLYMGDAAQVYLPEHKALMGGLVPEFRGVTTLYFSGQICSNNPYPKVWKIRAARNVAGWQDDTPWYPDKALIVLPGGKGLNGSIRAQNPAHIIYECITNSVWGKGEDTSIIDEDTFTDAANTFCAEGLGLCLKWDRQGTIDDFMATVGNHVLASMYTDRATGKICLYPIRNNYVRDELPLFDATSGLLSIQKATASGSNGVNQVIVNYTDMANQGRAGSARYQALAAITAAGGAINSATAEYPGLPTFALAMRIAQRDAGIAVAGVQAFTLTMDRRAWKIFAGMPFRISAPERGIVDMVVRAAKIDDTTLKDGKITLQVAQDVFDLPDTTYADPETPGWVPPAHAAVRIDNRRVEEANYRLYAQRLPPGDLAVLEITSGAIATLARKPNGTTLNYEIFTRLGAVPYVDEATGDFTTYARLAAGMGYYSTSATLTGITSANLDGAEVGKAVLVGGEIMRITAVDLGAGTMSVLRGCVDTLPLPHAANTAVFFPDSFTYWDRIEYSAGDTVDVKLCSRTFSALLDVGLADSDSVSIIGRQGLPYPPGNLKVNDTLVYGVSAPDSGDLVFTWSRRNRLTQLDTLVSHTDSDIVPESGQTVTIRIYDNDTNTLLHAETGITGVTWTYDSTLDVSLGGPTTIRFEVLSLRDGFDSMTFYSFTIHRVGGFGDDFGDDFGSTS